MFTAHDWLAHLVNGSYWWNAYDCSLKQIVMEHSTSRPLLADWVTGVIDQPLTNNVLLYRHYLVTTLLDDEIYARPTDDNFYILAGSMLTYQSVFAPLQAAELWEGIDTDPFPINVLRYKQPLIRHYIHRLSIREDVTDHHLQRSHGLLSSLSLLYGLYLIRVVLIHEMTVRPEPSGAIILESLSNTLTQLKGVFNNVTSQRLSPHV